MLTVDDGAFRALTERGKSLLAAGITDVSGKFKVGDLVEIAGPSGAAFARGLVNFSAETLDTIKGLKSEQIRERIDEMDYEEVIHRDNMVVFE